MSAEPQPSISISLTPAQVDQVVRAAAGGRTPSLTALIGRSRERSDEDRDRRASTPGQGSAGDADGDPDAPGYMLGETSDPRLSRSLVRGLSILTCFGPDARARGIVELADDLGMSASTAHRYASTLVELGLLERCPKTRKYRPAGV
jgi:IclR-like helix-turn-helix domain-containing protein